MAVLPRPKNAITLTNPDSSTPMPVVTNELAYQFLEPPRQFLILTNVGITVLAKRRALDWLRDAIEEVQADGNVQPIIDFRDRYYLAVWPQLGHCAHTRIQFWPRPDMRNASGLG
jgi:nuclear pore complex protein Nup155